MTLGIALDEDAMSLELVAIDIVDTVAGFNVAFARLPDFHMDTAISQTKKRQGMQIVMKLVDFGWSDVQDPIFTEPITT